MSKKTKYIICFEYFGRDFYGSQKQPNKRTVQNEIEKAICTLTKEKVNIVPSGRTDAGVSAEYQTAHFTLEKQINKINDFLYHLNCILPADVKIFKLDKVNNSFHAQKSAKYKHYRYIIQNDSVASVFYNNNLFYPYGELNIERINQALSYLLGYHDFSAFKSKSSNPYNDCEIYFAKAIKNQTERNTFIFIDIIGNRFLYNMVRTIVGEILFIERNNYNPELMLEILNSKNRAKAANVVEAKGLYLKYVGYDDVNTYIEKLIQKEGK